MYVFYTYVHVQFLYIIDESMPFHGLIGLFRVTGIKEAQELDNAI